MGDGEWASFANEEKAIAMFDGIVESLCEKYKADPIMCLSSPDHRYFRHEIYPDYKAQRRQMRKPLLIKPLQQHAKSYTHVVMNRLEADDVMGILATGDRLKGKKGIVSPDKDMAQIPNTLIINSRSDNFGKAYKSTPEEGVYQHMFQTLTGDVVDNYPGCPDIGPKRAEKILADPYAYWDAVVEAFEKKGLTEEDALVQARLAKILEAVDWDSEVKQPILWSP